MNAGLGSFHAHLCLSLFICGSTLLSPPPLRADSQIDGIEHIFGATNVNAVTGHGRLSAGVSIDGDLTVLTWPSPSFADQLTYLSSNDVHARALPLLGAQEGAGAFLGLLIRAGEQRTVTWLRNRDRWRIEQSYGPDDGANVWTVHTDDALGLTVTVVDAVRPDSGAAQVLVRRVTVERRDDSPVDAAWLLTYANLSPTPPNARVPELPIVDWLFDGSNDFAALWDASAAAVVHFHPRDELIYDDLLDFVSRPTSDYGAVGELLKEGTPAPEELARLAADLDDSYADGAYLALTTLPAPDQHQIGYDGTPICTSRDEIADNILALPETFPGVELPIDPALVDLLRCGDAPSVPEREGWTHEAEDAFEDAADGELSGSGIAAGEVNAALRTPLVFVPAGEGSRACAAVVIGAGPTATEARAAVASAGDAASVVQAAEDEVANWLAGLHLPASGPPEVRAVARRSLINLRVGTDAPTGAIVASISRQPPYGLDWPRDGAFFNAALDVSGQSELAGRRADLYVDWQRDEPAAPTALIDLPPPVDPTTGESDTYPADAWEMNYYPDGTIGGVFRFEIDNAAFALWTIVSHVGWVDNRPRDYLLERWDAIERAADLLARWRDAETGLTAPAQEDDNAAYTSTLHGAVTVFGALDIAARAARFAGRSADAVRWEARACELRNATLALLYDREAERFVLRPGEEFDPARAPTGQTAWLVWPGHLLPWDDERVEKQIEGDLVPIESRVRLETEGGSYFMKNTVAFGLARGTDPVIGAATAELRDRLAVDHPTPRTHHFGESMLVVGGEASQRVANPHLWEGILFYLTAMALDAPERFDRFDTVLPPSRLSSAGEVCRVPPPCLGDCDGDFAVDVDELVLGVGISTGATDRGRCLDDDADGDGTVGVGELVGAVGNALQGCPQIVFR